LWLISLANAGDVWYNAVRHSHHAPVPVVPGNHSYKVVRKGTWFDSKREYYFCTIKKDVYSYIYTRFSTKLDKGDALWYTKLIGGYLIELFIMIILWSMLYRENN